MRRPPSHKTVTGRIAHLKLGHMYVSRCLDSSMWPLGTAPGSGGLDADAAGCAGGRTTAAGRAGCHAAWRGAANGGGAGMAEAAGRGAVTARGADAGAGLSLPALAARMGRRRWGDALVRAGCTATGRGSGKTTGSACAVPPHAHEWPLFSCLHLLPTDGGFFSPGRSKYPSNCGHKLYGSPALTPLAWVTKGEGGGGGGGPPPRLKKCAR